MPSVGNKFIHCSCLFSTTGTVDSTKYLESMREMQTELLYKFDNNPNTYTAVSFFRFVAKSESPDEERVERILESLRENLSSFNVLGTFLLSSEGYNSALIIPTVNLQRTYQAIVDSDQDGLFQGLDWNVGNTNTYRQTADDKEDVSNEKQSENDGLEFPFKKLLVKSKFSVLTDRLKDEIRQRGDEKEIDWTDAGPELEPSDWHAALGSDENYMLLDCRNNYESEVGTFQGAVPLNTNIFSESWEKLDQLLEDVPKNTPIMTFCTGGIRCIKTNAYLKQKLGMTNIGRLKKGIIGYEQWVKDSEGGEDAEEAEIVRPTKSLFVGENFLFDRRRLGREDKSSGAED